MDNQRLINAGILGGAVAALFNATPVLNLVNCFCCAGVLAGGAFGMLYYDRSQEEKLYFGPAQAITIGLVSGIFGAFFSLFIEWAIYLAFGDWQLDMVNKLIENMDEVPDYIYDLAQEMEDGLRHGFMWTFALIRNLLIMPVFCMGGALIMRTFLVRNRMME